MTRSFMLDQLAQEYVTTARVKGVPERLVIWRHAFRPIRVPLITVLGLSPADKTAARASGLESTPVSLQQLIVRRTGATMDKELAS